MDDRRIENLVRMAGEIDEFEREAMVGRSLIEPSVRRVGGWRVGVVARIGAFTAAAACVAAAVVFSRAPRPATLPRVVHHGAPVPADREGSAATALVDGVRSSAVELVPVDAGVRGETSVVMGIFEDAKGEVRCVQWRPHDWGGRSPDELAPGELVKETYGPHCVVGPHLLIAVNVSGPLDELPKDDAEAQHLASCIIGESTTPMFKRCSQDPKMLSPQAVECIPSGLKVRVETLAMGK